MKLIEQFKKLIRDFISLVIIAVALYVVVGGYRYLNKPLYDNKFYIFHPRLFIPSWSHYPSFIEDEELNVYSIDLATNHICKVVGQASRDFYMPSPHVQKGVATLRGKYQNTVSFIPATDSLIIIDSQYQVQTVPLQPGSAQRLWDTYFDPIRLSSPYRPLTEQEVNKILMIRPVPGLDQNSEPPSNRPDDAGGEKVSGNLNSD